MARLAVSALVCCCLSRYWQAHGGRRADGLAEWTTAAEVVTTKYTKYTKTPTKHWQNVVDSTLSPTGTAFVLFVFFVVHSCHADKRGRALPFWSDAMSNAGRAARPEPRDDRAILRLVAVAGSAAAGSGIRGRAASRRRSGRCHRRADPGRARRAAVGCVLSSPSGVFG